MSTHTERDVLIVGAGLSGINMACRLQEQCPDLTYDIVDAREAIGGTWDLFRYPGIRSDSDVYTLALPFLPWRGKNSIVEGHEIRAYLHEATRRFGVERNLRLKTRVRSANWSSAERRWHVAIDADGQEETYVVRFLIVCTGYYDYESPHDPGFPGIETFSGRVIHPQFWPEEEEVRGKKIAVIGSGATAITLVPALADRGAEVTMVQRTPTWILSQPRTDVVADVLRRRVPLRAAHQLVRVKNTALQWGLYQTSQRAPGLMRKVLRSGAVSGVGSRQIVEDHLTPPYDPWDQRLCVAPEGDFFAAIKDKGASIVTGHIDSIVPEGIRMEDGSTIEADIIVTATGLRIKLLGGIDVQRDGESIDASSSLVYLGAMLSGVPNMAFCVGYINLSWTMRADLTARLVSRILRRFVDTGATQVVPVPPSDVGETGPLLDMKSGYLARAADAMPRAAKKYPWTMMQNVVLDAWSTNRADLDDGLAWDTSR